MATLTRAPKAKNLLPYDGLREWIQKLEQMGDLRLVEGADCAKDIGQDTELLQHHPDAPCVLFDKIPGYQGGFRVLVNLYGTPARMALAYGLPTDMKKGPLSLAILEMI